MVLKTITGARGVTFSGDTFVVPQTHDMVKTLFDPTIRKSIFETAIVVLLFANGIVFLVPDNSLQVKAFIGLYVFWRLMYDFGIGYLLRAQSNSQKLVNWAKSLDVFNPHNNSLLARLIRSEIRSQMGPEYDISSYPIEFNTWLVFRKVVDLILMSDFTTFVGLVVSCSISNDFQFINVHQQSAWLVATRLVVGSVFILFNLWVKINAHNTIKDYAWYWGDFFFRQFNNEELIFDGVFEMVPHPMYSVGYIGYYGFALISKSYTVLTLACFGHFLQMVFLHFIENPHIDKIYGPSPNEVDLIKLIKLRDLQPFDNLKPMIGLFNFHWSRGSDVAICVLVLTFSLVFPLSTAYTTFLYDQFEHSQFFLNKTIFGFTLSPINMFFLLTVFIKLAESVSINLLLFFQSSQKYFTKFYISNDIPIERSLKNWAILYNTLISLTYSSFFGLNFCFYLIGLDKFDLLFNDWFRLRIFLGSILVLTHVWINTSIVDSIGYFGWFYGDFFIPRSSLPHKAHLTKAGVYRYLNNPEQIFGVCGIMGVTLVVPSVSNCVLCALWVLNNFVRINFIEKIHMIRLYGEQEVLQDSGVTKTLKKHLIPESIQRRLSNNNEKPTLSPQRKNSVVANATNTIDQIIKEFKKSNTKLTKQNITELSQNLYFENSDYNLRIRNLAHNDSEDNALKYIEVGAPIEVEWRCPENHSLKDWVGLYRIVQTSYSRYKTLISSNNRWSWVGQPSSNGVLRFEGQKLFWEEGIYEFRYHLDGKHDVAYISEPFEIKCPRIEVPSSTEEILNFSKVLKSTIFDKVISVETVNSPVNEVVEKSDNILGTYRKLACLISCSTNIKISSKIFLFTDNSDLSILKLASKLVHAKKVLDELSSEHYDEEKKNQ